jgi:hypothetical protein
MERNLFYFSEIYQLPYSPIREQYERKPWLLGRHEEKLNNSARIV